MAPFASVADRSAAPDWEQLAALAGPETTLAVFSEEAPPGWERLGAYDCLQYVFEGGALPDLPALEGDARLVEPAIGVLANLRSAWAEIARNS